MKGDVRRSEGMPIDFLAGPSLNKRRIVKIAILECYLMLQRIKTFIKQWEPLPLLFLFLWLFFLKARGKYICGKAMKLFKRHKTVEEAGETYGIDCTEIRRNIGWQC